MAKKKMYTFSEHRHSRKGITSTILGGISLVLFVVLAYIAWWSYGEGGPILGSLGFTGIIFAICGLVSGLSSFREKCGAGTLDLCGPLRRIIKKGAAEQKNGAALQRFFWYWIRSVMTEVFRRIRKWIWND